MPITVTHDGSLFVDRDLPAESAYCPWCRDPRCAWNCAAAERGRAAHDALGARMDEARAAHLAAHPGDIDGACAAARRVYELGK